jgi:hypothetical protein
LASCIVSDYTTGNLGDITGTGTGKGTARARAVGAGVDPDLARAVHEAALVERSGWVAELLAGEHELGRALMLLAGGREFLGGRTVRLNGSGMAPRAARYLVNGGAGQFKGRGRTPSDTSLEDAAAAAAAELALQVRVWEYALGIPGALPAARVREDVCIRSHLAGCAWRAAFRSLTDDAAAESGPTAGRQAAEQPGGVSLALTAGQIASQRASLEAWARGERNLVESHEAETVRALSSWVWRSLVPPPVAGAGANGERERAGARQRARFLIRLIHGATWADAARLAGYRSGLVAATALRLRHTWRTLGRAALLESDGHPVAVQLARAWQRAARAEVEARRAARPWLHTSAPRGARRVAGARAVGPVLAGGAGMLVRAVVSSPAARPSGRVHRYGTLAALAVDVGAAARRAIDRREQAARVTSGAAARLVAFRARAEKDWEQAARGLRRGWLRG